MAKPRLAKSSPPKTSAVAPIPENWQRWIAENKLLGITDEVITDILVRNGMAKNSVAAELQKMAAHPYFNAFTPMMEKVRKYEALLDLYISLEKQSPRYGQVGVEHKISPEKFMAEYYSQNRPVLLTGMMENWKALDLWNPDYLKAKFGNEMVEIQYDRDKDFRYERNSYQHKKQITFSEYTDMVVNAGETNNFYMTANNQVLRNPGMQAIYDDIEMFPEFIDPRIKDGQVFFWFGPAGTITPLHHDRNNIFVCQVYGRKRVKLISSKQLPLMYNDLTVFTDIDCEQPDYDKYPRFRDVTVIEGVLEPGQVLFLPTGWWHHLRALDISLTVTFTNFIFDNPIFNW